MVGSEQQLHSSFGSLPFVRQLIVGCRSRELDYVVLSLWIRPDFSLWECCIRSGYLDKIASLANLQRAAASPEQDIPTNKTTVAVQSLHSVGVGPPRGRTCKLALLVVLPLHFRLENAVVHLCDKFKTLSFQVNRYRVSKHSCFGFLVLVVLYVFSYNRVNVVQCLLINVRLTYTGFQVAMSQPPIRPQETSNMDRTEPMQIPSTDGISFDQMLFGFRDQYNKM